MARKLYIGTNTKMYKTIAQTVDFIESLGELTADISRSEMELFVIPSFTTLEAAHPLAEAANIRLGAQNMAWEDEGQFTGEISPVMLREVGVEIAEIGHSERRHVFGEDDEMENRKLVAALHHNMTPLLCIGETERQKQLCITDEILRMQVKVGLFGIDAAQAARVWVAYEPVWAIGVGKTPADSSYAEEKHRVIKSMLAELFGEGVAASIPVLYGGSVNLQNAAELAAQPHIDGLFVGRNAWDAENFNRIIRAALPVFKARGGAS